MLHNESYNSTEFYYNDNTRIYVGDTILFNVMNKKGIVNYVKGALCITFFDNSIPDILFYNIYIHDNNIIKAFNKITNK